MKPQYVILIIIAVVGIVIILGSRGKAGGNGRSEVCRKYARDITESDRRYRYKGAYPAKGGGGYIAMYVAIEPTPQGVASTTNKSITKQEFADLAAC